MDEKSEQRFLPEYSCVIIPCSALSFQSGITIDAVNDHPMSKLLAIDASSDACSVALYSDGEIRDFYEVVPRQHSVRLFSMLRELLPDGNLRAQGIDAIAYACGPGSFTGLRIAASVVQGLAFANQLPAIAVSSLACQAQTAIRSGLVSTGQNVLSMMDARMNEIYWAQYRVEGDLPMLTHEPQVGAPQSLYLNGDVDGDLIGVGSGFTYVSRMPESVSSSLSAVHATVLPSARDLLPLALRDLQSGRVQPAKEVAPVYVREEISWKKIPQQGRQ